MTSARSRSRRGARPALAALALVACGGGAGGGSAAPVEGARGGEPAGEVVLRLDGEPIEAAEVAEVVAWVRELYPQHSVHDVRRKALHNYVLPRVLARRIAPEERARAERESREALAALRAEGGDGPPAREATASWDEMGLGVWHALGEAAPGEWVGPVEHPGRFLLARALEPEVRREHGIERLRVELVEFPYLGPDERATTLSEALDEARLEIVDPAWEDSVPAHWKYRRP